MSGGLEVAIIRGSSDCEISPERKMVKFKLMDLTRLIAARVGVLYVGASNQIYFRLVYSTSLIRSVVQNIILSYAIIIQLKAPKAAKEGI